MTDRLARVLAAVSVSAFAGGCAGGLPEPLRPMPIHPPGRYQQIARAGTSTDVRTGDAADAKHTWYAKPNGRIWRYVVIHHSASSSGSAKAFDRYHRLQRGWDELGYHFVIDNGHGGPDGRVEVGPRWTKQKHGAHCGGTPDNEYNEYGIGICLVGSFSTSQPSPAQLSALSKLLTYLMRTHRISPINVIGHRDAPSAGTACPGDNLQRYVIRTLRPKLRQALAKRTQASAGVPR